MTTKTDRLTRTELDRRRRYNRCKVCASKLDLLFNIKKHRPYLACHKDPSHEGFERIPLCPDVAGAGKVNTRTGEIVEGEVVSEATEGEKKSQLQPDEIPWEPETDTDNVDETANKREPAEIKTVHELQVALFNDFGLQPSAQLAELNIKKWSDLGITPSEAYIQVAAAR